MNNLGYSNIIQECMENLLLAEKQLHKFLDDENNIENFRKEFPNDLEEFWKDISLVSKKLSHECTKLCICFCNSPPPSSEETSGLIQVIEKTVLALVGITYKLNPICGKTLYKEVFSNSINAIQSTRQLLRVINEEEGDGVQQRYRRATGVAWEGCKYIENSSRNNKDAVLKVLKSQYGLVSDAFDEISQALEGGDDLNQFGSSSDSEEPSWSDTDKQLINPTVNLIKASKMFFKRIIEMIEKNGSCDNVEKVNELDQILNDAEPISADIDSLVLEIYPPLNIANMDVQSQQMAEHLLSTLKSATKTHIITENEQANVEFINHAIHHNLDKLKELLRNL